MRKIPVIFLAVVLLFTGTVSAKEKDSSKLLAGCIMSVCGGLVAYSGFKMAEISVPEMSVTSFTTVTAGAGPYDISASGTVKNTGNVPLKNITLIVEYKDNTGALIQSQDDISLSANSAMMNSGGSDTFSSSLTGLASEPLFFSVRYRADYDREYVNSSVSTGIAGTAIFAIGAFFICDYFFDITDFFEKQDVKVQLSSLNDGLNVMASRNF